MIVAYCSLKSEIQYLKIFHEGEKITIQTVQILFISWSSSVHTATITGKTADLTVVQITVIDK